MNMYKIKTEGIIKRRNISTAFAVMLLEETIEIKKNLSL